MDRRRYDDYGRVSCLAHADHLSCLLPFKSTTRSPHGQNLALHYNRVIQGYYDQPVVTWNYLGNEQDSTGTQCLAQEAVPLPGMPGKLYISGQEMNVHCCKKVTRGCSNVQLLWDEQ